LRGSARQRASGRGIWPGGRQRAARRSASRASIRATSKSSWGSPIASMQSAFARRFATLHACGFDANSTTWPSHQNQMGMRCGRPSGRTLESQTMDSRSRSASTRDRVLPSFSRCPASRPTGSTPRCLHSLVYWNAD
jgi:hypothetical protein